MRLKIAGGYTEKVAGAENLINSYRQTFHLLLRQCISMPSPAEEDILLALQDSIYTHNNTNLTETYTYK